MSQFRRDLGFVTKISSFVKPYFKNRKKIDSPLDTLILRVHYKASVGIFLCLFVSITSFWIVTDPMKCVLKFDRSQVIGYLEDICLSYPFVYNASIHQFPRSRVYALHYRWVHYALLILVFLYNLPLLCRKYLDAGYVNYCLNRISKPDSMGLNLRNTALDKLTSHVGRLGFFYWRILLLHFIVILVDVISFGFLDIVLQNRFARLFPLDYPFTRWPQHFNDSLSLSFPPFAECKIGPENMILINREETIGCSLPLMTIYQKCFIFLWLWMSFLTVWSILALFYYCYLGVSTRGRKRLIGIPGSRTHVATCVKYLSIGDLLVLHSLRHLTTSAEYRGLLSQVCRVVLDERERGIYGRMVTAPGVGWNVNLRPSAPYPTSSGENFN